MTLARCWTAALVLVLAAGCGTPGTSSAEKGPAQTYFDGVATQTVDSLQHSLDVARPGSPAAAYATYLRGSAQAAADGGAAPTEAEFTADHTDNGYRFCQGDGSDRTCFDYTHVEVVDGKVASFSVNDQPIAPRLTVGAGQEVDFDGTDATAAFVASYRTTATDLLFVVVTVRSGPTALGEITARYRPPGGGSASSTMQVGPDDLAAGSKANYAFAFPHAALGGKVTLSATGGGQAPVGTVTLATR